MKKKWMAAALSMMVAGGVVAGVANHPAFAAAPQAAKTLVKRHIDKADQEEQDNDKEVADSMEQAQLAKKATITQQQSIANGRFDASWLHDHSPSLDRWLYNNWADFVP